MGRKVLVILYILYLIFQVGSVSAAEHVAGDSAEIGILVGVPQMNRISYKNIVTQNSKKKRAVERVLERYQSPMKQSLDSFFRVCDSNELDCYLLPSIAGLESGFGRYVLAGSFNPFGWGGGYIRFSSWNEAISTVGTGLRQNYIGRGAQNIEQIGSKYAESPTWAARVRRYMAEFKAQEDQTAIVFPNPEQAL